MMTLERYRRMVALFLRRRTATAQRMTLFNVHFPGTHSLVLYDSDELMLRMYVVRPGETHRAHYDWRAPFLHHPHRYDLLSMPLFGSIVNERFAECAGPADWYRHSFERVGEFACRPVPGARTSLRPLGREALFPGEWYSMKASEIHRVGFLPCPATGWTVVLFYEFADVADAPYAYWRSRLTELPGASEAELYRRPTSREFASLREDLVTLFEGAIDAG